MNIMSKLSEEILRTSNIEEMKGLFLAERLVRTWKEDFVDEDTSEVVTIDRNELIFERGTLLDSSKLSEINFMLQSEDIKEVAVSNQNRQGYLISNAVSVWIVVFEVFSKKKTVYLYANSVKSAMDISIDFIEQKYNGCFKLKTVKESAFTQLISQNELISENEESEHYTVLVEVYDEVLGESFSRNFILKSTDAEKAKSSIIYFLQEERKKQNNNDPFEVTIISAKTVKCHDIIEQDFCLEYLNELTE